MKRLFTFFCFLLSVIVTANANPVDMQRARKIGAKYLQVSIKAKVASEQELTLVRTYRTSTGVAAMYVFNAPKGFVIVAADDCATPILGSSATGRFDVDNLPPALEEYLMGFVEQIEYGIESGLPALDTVAHQWELVQASGLLRDDRATAAAVAPLLTTQWGQGDDGYQYNIFCPEDPDGPNGHAITGCVATAMGQIMRYWRYPTTGSGEHGYFPPNYLWQPQIVNFGNTTYDWSNMPNELTPYSTDVENNAVATLLWHCGVSVNMDYFYDDSGAITEDAVAAMRDYFKYSSDLHYAERNSQYIQWLTKLINNLNQGRPILYRGRKPDNSAGHAFVCDGYNTDLALHFNWGWDGSHNDDYYFLDALVPDPNNPNQNYSAYNAAIFDIHPLCEESSYVHALPYYEGFEAGNTEFYCFLKMDLNNAANALCSSWTTHASNGSPNAYTGNLCAIRPSKSSLSANDWLIMSPVFLQPGRDASTLTFKTYEKSAGDYTFEGVYVSTTGNSPTDFTQVWTQNNPSASWKTVTVDLSAYQGNIVYIAFVYTGINGHTWLIDNVEITESWLPCNSVTAPYNQTFDSNLSSCWYVIDSDHSGDERCWKYDETNHCAVHPWGQQNVPQEGWLFSSRVELPSSNTYKLSFRSKNASSGTGQRNSVWIAVDKTGTPKISDYTQIWVDPSYSSSWTTYEIDLSQYAGHYVNIAFKYEGTFAHKWYIDDFNIVRICAITASANPSAGGSVSGTGTYNYGSTVTLTATPSTGYHFVNWTKNGTQVSTSSTYSFIASTNVSYVANFALNSYNITVTPNPSTGGSVSGAGTYNYGSTVTLTATPSTGYHFVNWTKNGTQVSTNLTYSFTANANAAYVANFALNSYNITATTYPSTGGFVTGGGTYNYGSTCTLTATSHAGYVFLAWTDNSGVVVSSDPVYSFEVTESKTLTANFMAGSDACSLTFDLYDSYGDGWNGNYLVVNHANGMSEKLAVPSNESFATFTLPFVDGSHVELSWITGSWTYECSFDVHYPNGNLVCVGRNLNGSFEYGFDMDCDGMPSIWAYVGDHSDNTSNYLPSYSYFNYSLSEQIYTANEIGTAGVIRGIAFYNAGTQAKTRTFDIYMKTTEKTAFASQTDWISASVTDKVFSGSVTIRPGKWTPIVFNTPFTYNGTSNIVLIVDDNTGDYTSSPHMACRVFNVNDNKALRIYSDNTDYDPNDPSVYNGILMSMKNQIQFDFLPSIVTQTTVLSQGWNWWSTYIEQGSINGLTMLENSLGGHGLTIKAQDAFVEYNNPTNTWTGGLNAIDNESGYKIKVSETCASVMAGPIAIPVNHPITLVQGWNWIGYPVTAAQVVTSALSGFTPSTGDIIKSQDAYASYSAGTGWTPSNYTLTPGECYMYYSGTSVDKTLVFAQSKGEASYKPEDCHWKADHHVYPDNLSVMAIVTVDGEEQRGDAIEIGAFVDGECRGSVKLYYVESLDRYIAFLTVTGKDGEEVEFRLLDESNGKTDTSPDHIFFRSNAIIGSFDSPYPIRFGAMASSENGLMRLYPNPVTRSQSFTLGIPEGERIIETVVTDALGAVVRHETGVLDKTMRGLSVSGVYMVKVVCESGNLYIGKLVVE